MMVRECVSVTCHSASFPGSTWVCKHCMKALILFSLLLTFIFRNKKTIVSPSLQEFLVKLSSERGREPIAERKKKKKQEGEMGRVPNKTHSMQILSGVKYEIIGCENWLLMLKIPCLIKANSLSNYANKLTLW